MRAQLGLGYATFCLLMSCAIAACASLACLRTPSGPVRLKDFLVCGLGGAVIGGLLVAFSLWQGNTLAGMLDALVLRTWQNVALGPVGFPLAIPRLAWVWAPTLAALGLFVSWGKIGRRLLLWPARALFCLAVVPVAASLGDRVGPALSVALPLVWLLLFPPENRRPSEAEWFLRHFFAFTACLQPLQIFPVAGDQVLIGTLSLPLAAILMVLDLWADISDVAARRPLLFADWVPILKRLAVIALAAVLIRFRRYEIFGGQWLVPSLMSSLSAFGAAIGLIALFARVVGPQVRLAAKADSSGRTDRGHRDDAALELVLAAVHLSALVGAPGAVVDLGPERRVELLAAGPGIFRVPRVLGIDSDRFDLWFSVSFWRRHRDCRG